MGEEWNWKAIDWNELDFLKWPGLHLVEAEDGHSVMELRVEEHHRGGRGSPDTVNGGIISYMFDAMCGSAVASTWDESIIGQATMTLNTQFMSTINAKEKVRAGAEPSPTSRERSSTRNGRSGRVASASSNYSSGGDGSPVGFAHFSNSARFACQPVSFYCGWRSRGRASDIVIRREALRFRVRFALDLADKLKC